MILRLRHGDGLGIAEIAAATHRSTSTISELLRKFGADTTGQAIALLKTSAEEAAQAWRDSLRPAAIAGRHGPALDLLVATGVISEGQPPIQIGVQVNVPGTGATLPPELVDLPDD